MMAHDNALCFAAACKIEAADAISSFLTVLDNDAHKPLPQS